MTSIQDPPVPPSAPATRHPVLRFTDSLGRALDSLTELPAWAMAPADQREALVTLRSQRARLEELELRVLVAADRNRVGEDAGATSTRPGWLTRP